MLFDAIVSEVGNVTVMTTEGRGFTPEEVAERALDKIIHVGGYAHPAIREQAEAFKDSIRQVLVHYMNEAVRSHNVTLVNKFHKAGHPELIPILDT
jgi:rRNA pseudouridine-1189 N-methylase Emg1 (Nep1/Mra1 family)